MKNPTSANDMLEEFEQLSLKLLVTERGNNVGEKASEAKFDNK